MKKLRLLGTLIAGSLLSLYASAQTAPISAAVSGNTGTDLGEIVVTAQKREQKIQDVPIAITAISGAKLDEERVEDNYGLVALTPALTVNRSTATTAVTFLRGVGSPNVIPGDEPSVATYVDGFYQGPANSAVLPYNNLDHVEVLMGPQGTLYGRNATGGLISLITPAPRDEFFAKTSAGYGNYDTFEGNGYVTGPVGNGIRADLALHYRDQGEGVARNLFTGHRVGVDDEMSLRAKIVFDIFANTSLTLGADYSNNNDSVGSSLYTLPGTIPLAALVGGKYSTAPFYLYNNVDPLYQVKAYGVTAKLESKLDSVKFVSMSQYRYYTAKNIVDLDGTSADNVPFAVVPTLGKVGLPTLTTYSLEKMPYFVTQEFQILSNGNGPFTWIGGAYGQDSREGYDPVFLTTNTRTFAPFVTIHAFSAANAYAGYAQGTYTFDNQLSLTAGGRYSYEIKHVEGSQLAGGVTTTDDKEKSFDAFTYRVSVDYKASQGLLLYALTSKGFKSGTFNTTTIDNSPAVNPETLYDYEIGFKSDPLPSLRVNGAAYYYDYKNIQYYSQTPQTLTVLSNAAAATLYGAELSVEARPVRNLTLMSAVALEHTNYDSFAEAPTFISVPTGGERQVSANATGEPLIQTPKITVSAGLSYDLDLPEDRGVLTLASSLYHNGGYPFDPAGQVNQAAYTTVHGSLAWTPPHGHWSATAWGSNLSDSHYYNQVTVGARGVRVGYTPLMYGITVHYKTE
jgi:iron complex outermembrane recepter protein